MTHLTATMNVTLTSYFNFDIYFPHFMTCEKPISVYYLLVCVGLSLSVLLFSVLIIWALGKDGWVRWCQHNSYSSSLEWLKKAGRTSSHLLVSHYEARAIISQPQCGRCHRAGTGQTTLEVIGSKWSCTLNWCKPNNDDDDGWDCCLGNRKVVQLIKKPAAPIWRCSALETWPDLE